MALIESAAHLAVGGIVVLAWYGLGRALLPRPRHESRLLAALSRVGLGALAFALVTFGAAAAGVLERWEAWAAVAACAAYGLLGLRRPRLRRPGAFEGVLLAVALVTAVLAVVATLAPISSEDALYYHVAVPLMDARAHGLVELPWSWESYQPATVEMLILDGVLLWDPVVGALAPLALGLIAAAAVFGAARRLAGGRVAALALAIFLVQPFAVWVATSSFVEPGIAAAVALSLWNLVELVRRPSTQAAWLVGLFAWAAAGMKYTGVVGAGLIVLAAAVAVRRPRLVVPLAASALVALPWYVRNAVETGNPLFPFLFHGLRPQAQAAAVRLLKGYGDGRTAGDAALLVPHFLVHGSAFDRGEYVSPLFVAFAPVALLDPRARRWAAVTLAGCACFVAFWFAESQQARLLVPLMPPLAVAAAVGAAALAARDALGRLVTAAVVGAALAVALGISVVYAARFVPVVVGAESKRAFLERSVPYYEALAWIDAHARPGERVLTDLRTGLYLPQPYEDWTPASLDPSAGPAAARRFLRGGGFSLVAVRAADVPRVAQLRGAGYRVVARVRAHNVVSRTRAHFGPPEQVLMARP